MLVFAIESIYHKTLMVFASSEYYYVSVEQLLICLLICDGRQLPEKPTLRKLHDFKKLSTMLMYLNLKSYIRVSEKIVMLHRLLLASV